MLAWRIQFHTKLSQGHPSAWSLYKHAYEYQLRLEGGQKSHQSIYWHPSVILIALICIYWGLEDADIVSFVSAVVRCCFISILIIEDFLPILNCNQRMDLFWKYNCVYIFIIFYGKYAQMHLLSAFQFKSTIWGMVVITSCENKCVLGAISDLTIHILIDCRNKY